MLVEHHRDYRKVPWYNSKLKQIIGQGLLTNEGESWVRQRRLAQPVFRHERLQALGVDMTDATLRQLEHWREFAGRGTPFDVASEMMRLTLTIVAQTLLGADVRHEADAVGEAVTAGLEYAVTKMGSYVDWPVQIPLPLHRRFTRARATLDRIVYRIITDRRQSGTDTGDLLSMLLRARDAETGATMTDRQVRDEVMTTFLAGHETTAVALTWTWFLLAAHPDAAHRLQAELASVLGSRTPTAGDLPHLPYTRMVLEESMRLYPPVWGLSRTPIVDVDLGGHRISKGTIIYLSPYLTHRHPAFWDDPDRFDPDRFRSDRSAARPRFAYFPFGAGPRQCIGAGFAMMEARLVLATVAQRYALDLAPGHPVSLDPKITLRPRFGLRMIARELHPQEDERSRLATRRTNPAGHR